MLKKTILIFLFLSPTLFGDDIPSALHSNALELYNTLIKLSKDMRWFFALLPVIGIIMSISKDIHNIKQNKSSMSQSEKLDGEDVAAILINVVIVLLSFFIIYGTFGLVYANANSMTEVWEKLVMDFWRTII